MIEEDFLILKLQNEGPGKQKVNRAVDRSYIQFHFCLKGTSKFVFNQGRYALDVSDEQSLLLYNTQTDLPINLELSPKTWMLSVIIPIRKFHSLFSREADYIHFLSAENKDKKYYAQEGVSPAISVILSQIMNYNFTNSMPITKVAAAMTIGYHSPE